MSSIDERVVSMKFDNKQLEDGIKTTLTSLTALNNGLKLEGATKGLNDVSSAASKLNFGKMGEGIDAIASKFKALGVVGVTALVNITNKAVDAGIQMAKSLSVSPILDGFHEYETNLNAIQTILSNTAWQHTGLSDVNEALNNLNHYSDLTIYNFSEMARNIGTFTAAGVKLDTSVNAIKGIANLAAISGSSAEQASTAMYQLSQALATGTLKLQDWNSVVNAGMGGKVFQDALMETARVHGVAIDKMVKEEGGFRNTLQEGWLTSNILTETLSKFAGDLSAKQLKAIGYTDDQIKGILALGKNATDAATKVKTFTQLVSTLQEAVGSGWTQTWQVIFGDFDEAKNLFTGVYNTLNGFIQASNNARNKVLADWKELGGRTAIINAIKYAFNDLIAVIKPIKDAFREIFPATTGKQLADLSHTIEKFFQNLLIGTETADKLKRTFAGIFAVLGIGWDIFKEGVKFVAELFGEITKGSGSVLNTTASIGDFLVALKKFLVDGGKIHDFFQGLEKIIAAPIRLLKEFVGWIAGAVKGTKDDMTPAVENLGKVMTPLEDIGHRLMAIWDGLKNIFSAVGKALRAAGTAIKDAVISVVNAVGNGFGGLDYSKVLDGINTGLLAGIVLLVRKFLKGGIKLDFGGGFLDKIKAAFGGLTDTLKAMQLQLKANALIKIASAVVILTAAVVALSLIDSAKLTAAMTAMTVMFTQLAASMAILEKIGNSKGFAKMPFITASMILMAAAVDLLVISVVALSKLDWNELSKGLTGLGVLLGELIVAMKLMPQTELISTAAGLVIMAAAIKILASAMADFAELSWADLGKGLAGVAIVIGALILVSKTMKANKGGLLEDVEFLLLAAAIKVLASAVAAFAKMKWGEVARGLVAMAGAMIILVSAVDALPPTAALGGAGLLLAALSLGKVADALAEMGKLSWGAIGKGLTALLGSLTIISLAIGLVPPTAPIAAAGIYVTALALLKVADVLEQMGQMSWGEIGKAMVALAGSLTIIALAVTAMIFAVPGAAALVVITLALAAFIPILLAFGKMSWDTVVGGMLKLAAALGILGATSLLMAAFTPLIFALGVAITALSVGLLVAGVAVLAFATGLTLLSKLGEVAAENIRNIVLTLLGLLPLMAQKLGEAVIAFAKVIGDGGPAILKAITTILEAMITAIVTLTPKIQDALVKLLLGMLKKLADNVPKFVDAGFKILIGFLDGVANNIGRVVTSATNVIVNFLNGLANNMPRIVDAGFNLIIKFIKGITDAINKHSKELGDAGGDLAVAIIKGMVNGLSSGVGKVVDAAKNVAKKALEAAKHFLGIFSPSREFYALGAYSTEGMANGLTETSDVVAIASAGVGKKAIDAMQKTLGDLPAKIRPEMPRLQPVVSPVLDLSQFTEDVGKIDPILSTKPLVVATTSDGANAAHAGFSANAEAMAEAQAKASTTVNFTQNNTSPKALSTADIYRQTNNQLSKVKKEVAAV